MLEASEVGLSLQKTLCIIKPDSVRQKKQGAIVQRILDSGLEILSMRQLTLSRAMAEQFYGVHRERPFFQSLVDFMVSGPVVVAALRGEDAVNRYRELIGATDPAKAADGTLRKDFGKSLGENAVHGSDSEENGLIETSFFFTGSELG